MICIIKVGNLVQGVINILTLGRGKDIATYIAHRMGFESCGCEERRIYLNELFGCNERIL